MSSLAVTVERLAIHEHPNADNLELAQVGHYRAVVKKGEYETGDYALYIPEQAILPPELIEELGLVGYLAGKEKNRVKAVRLRQEVSQGIACRPQKLGILWDDLSPDDCFEGVDWSADLGIVKWEPPIPVGMAGKVVAAPDLIRWGDIESIQRYPDIFTPGEPVVATEKIHGTCCLYTWGPGHPYAEQEEALEYVSSKGFGGQNFALQEDERNLYWRAARQHSLVDVASFLCGYFRAKNSGVEKVGLFGEVYGRGVQDLHYGKDAGHDDTLGYALFDVAYVDRGQTVWVQGSTLDEIWSEMGFTLPRVPELYRGPYDYELLAKLAEGRSTLHDGTIREGLVIRPQTERRSDILGGRAIAKLVSKGYLLRKGETTEYE